MSLADDHARAIADLANYAKLTRSYADERDSLLAEVRVLRSVLEECRPIVKARLIDADDLHAPLCDGSILDRINEAIAGNAPHASECAALRADNAHLRAALEKLAQLGGGRSEGNWIAKDALNGIALRTDA